MNESIQSNNKTQKTTQKENDKTKTSHKNSHTILVICETCTLATTACLHQIESLKMVQTTSAKRDPHAPHMRFVICKNENKNMIDVSCDM